MMIDTFAVKTALLLRGMTIKELAKQAGFRRDYLSRVIWNHRRSSRAQRRIAKILKRPLAELTAETPRRSY